MVVRTDRHGHIMHRYHDGYFLSVAVDGNECRMRYRSTDGVEHEVLLTGVHRLDVSNFRQGNVILDIAVVPTNDYRSVVPDKMLLRLGGGEMPKVVKGKYYFYMDASYGAEIIAECDDVEVHDVGPAGVP